LLGAQLPGLSEALKPAQPRHAAGASIAPGPKAVPGPAPAPREEPRQAAQAPAQKAGGAPAAAQKQPVAAKVAKANDEEWWTE
jgi:hypothetical protein